MRPASLRRFGIAAVAGGLLLASGTVPGYASDVETIEGTQTTRVTGVSDQQVVTGSWIRALLNGGTRTLERFAQHAASWGNKAFVLAVAPQPVPVRIETADQPGSTLGVIVDDGAPF